MKPRKHGHEELPEQADGSSAPSSIGTVQVSNPGRLVKGRHSIWLIQIERTGRRWHEKPPTSKTRRNSSPSLKNSIKLLRNAKTSFAAGSQKELPQKERAATSFSSWMMNRAFVLRCCRFSRSADFKYMSRLVSQ